MGIMFTQICEKIYRKNPLQKKAIQAFLHGQDALYLRRAQEFADTFSPSLDRSGISIDSAIDGYLNLCSDMLREQVKFNRTGRYSCVNAQEAYSALYSSAEKMAPYLHGLALSTFFWPNHYAIYDFYLQETGKLQQIRSCLEIGPGHGLYLAQAAKAFPGATFMAIDISPAAIELTKNFLTHLIPENRGHFRVGTIDDLKTEQFDHIIMGEVLEHLDNPSPTLAGLRRLMKENATLFLTTCANCPASDHVYLFDNVDHITKTLTGAGFKIIADLALAVDNSRPVVDRQVKIPLNYAAMLAKDLS